MLADCMLTPSVCRMQSDERGPPGAGGRCAGTLHVPHTERQSRPAGCRRALCGHQACAARVALSAACRMPTDAVRKHSAYLTGSA